MATKSENPDLLEIIFENRNKAYGAYPIRREHPKTMQRVLIYFLSGFAILLAAPHLLASYSDVFDRKADEKSIVIELDKDLKIEKLKPLAVEKIAATPKVAAQKAFVPPLVVQNTAQVIETPPDTRELEQTKTNIGKFDRAGDPEGSPEPIENPGSGIIEEPKASIPEPKNAVFDFVEIMPTFPGGDAELLKFLKKNVKYPPQAREAGIEGRVLVNFVVTEKGELTGAKIVMDIGGGCGKEVLRVLQTMPRWRAGEQNGQLVRVSLTIPVKFELGK